MREGKLLKSEIVWQDGEKLYVEKVAFKDWHVCIHAYYLISDRLSEGHTIVEQRWSYEDFCNITIRLEDCTYTLIRQVDVIALVRSYRPIPVDEFDRLAQPPDNVETGNFCIKVWRFAVFRLHLHSV